MMYLLDINVLLAFAYESHVLHSRAESWVNHVESIEIQRPLFALCSIVELGFIRIASGKSKLAESLSVAASDLLRIKAVLQTGFLVDDVDGNELPRWVTRSKQTTDGHLLELATRYQMQLATLDGGIPGAFRIPKDLDPSFAVREPTPVYDPVACWGTSSRTKRDSTIHSMS